MLLPLKGAVHFGYSETVGILSQPAKSQPPVVGTVSQFLTIFSFKKKKFRPNPPSAKILALFQCFSQTLGQKQTVRKCILHISHRLAPERLFQIVERQPDIWQTVSKNDRLMMGSECTLSIVECDKRWLFRCTYICIYICIQIFLNLVYYYEEQFCTIYNAQCG